MDYLRNKAAECLRTKSYCGYLDQNEFSVRYHFIKNRISNSFTREELAFLLGRTPYFVIDYEELSTNTKLNISDSDFLCQILKRGNYETLKLDKTCGKTDISYEKRMVRVIQREYSQKFVYEFVHPWTTGGICEPLKAVEPKYDTVAIEKESRLLVNDEIIRLIKTGYFNSKKSPFLIYEKIWNTYKYDSTAWSVTVLKELIYGFIRQDELLAEQINGHFTYKLKSIEPL